MQGLQLDECRRRELATHRRLNLISAALADMGGPEVAERIGALPLNAIATQDDLDPVDLDAEPADPEEDP